MWTPRDEEILRRMAPARSVQTVAQIVAKPETKVRAKCRAESYHKTRPWTADENEALAHTLLRTTLSNAAAMLRRSPEECVAQAERLGVLVLDDTDEHYQRWTDEERQVLKVAHRQGFGWQAIAARLKRTEESCKTEGRRLGLAEPASPDWTEDQDAVLREHWRKKVSREIGDMVGRSGDAVRARARVLGLTQKP